MLDGFAGTGTTDYQDILVRDGCEDDVLARYGRQPRSGTATMREAT